MTDPALDEAVAKLSQVLDGYLGRISGAVWNAAIDDAAHQGAGVAEFVVGDTSRRVERLVGLLDKRWAWENQDDTPEDQRGEADLVQFFVATNGQVYRNAAILAAIVAQLDAQSAKLDAILAQIAADAGNVEAPK